jgi:2-polyprenyl-6-hydroxyphenyl methylase/3-demethylubiquinone-9 3-methyltransferase
MSAKELAGGSYHWWPPRNDHVFLFKLNPVRFDYFDRFVAEWEGLRVLDVGSGGGYACEFLARRHAVVTGTDILEASLREAGDHAAQVGLPIEYRSCTTERLPFPDRSMDVVTCFDVLEHVSGKEALIAELYRVLKPGGWLFCDTFNRTFWSCLVIIWLGCRSVTDRQCLRFSGTRRPAVTDLS